MIKSTGNFSFTNFHLPINLQLAIDRQTDKWLIANNLANAKCEMINEATEGAV